MLSYNIQDAQLGAAILELLTDIMAQQSALAELVLKQMANGDEEKYQYLVADIEQKVQAQWHRVFDNISTTYAQLPVEIFDLIQKGRAEDGRA